MKHTINQSRICRTKVTWTGGFSARLRLLTLAFTRLATIERCCAGTSSASKSKTNRNDKINQASQSKIFCLSLHLDPGPQLVVHRVHFPQDIHMPSTGGNFFLLILILFLIVISMTWTFPLKAVFYLFLLSQTRCFNRFPF